MLYDLSSYTLPNPLIFRIHSTRTNRSSFCGVLEFVAPEDMVILPMWIFKNLGVLEEEMVSVALNPIVPKSNFLKLRPHQTAFIELPDPRAFLEIKFRDFVCVTQGDTIEIPNDLAKNETFKFDIIEVKPINPMKTVSLIDCDLKLDFEQPLDYIEEQPALKKKVSSLKMGDDGQLVFREFRGKYQRLDGREVKNLPHQEDDEYDPRQHRLPNGVRETFKEENFVGKKVRVG